MIKHIVLAVSAAAAIAAAAAVAIVAAAFGVFALLEPEVGSAGAAGLVALFAAALIGVIGLIAWLKVRPKKAAKGPPEGDMLARAMNLARERPIVAAAALIAGSVIAFRNPALTALAVKGFMDSKKPPKK